MSANWRRGVVFLFSGALFLGVCGPTSAQTAGVADKYKSCSYPPSKPGPVKVNAKSWKKQGFGATHIKGVDVSMWQHSDGKPIDFKKLKEKYGLKFVFIKASDGGNRDEGRSKKWFAIDSAAARKEGLIVGGYHYAVPGVMNVKRKLDAKIQARQAVRQAQGVPTGDLPITLDFEELPCGWSIKKLGYWAKDYVLEVERLTGRKPIIYANGVFLKRLHKAQVAKIDFASYPLWTAQWGPSLGTTPNSVPIWGTDWSFWQFTSDGSLKGVPSARTDLNVFNGTINELKALTQKH